MKKKTMLAAAIFGMAFFTSVVFAQETRPENEASASSSAIGKNWFLSAGIGGNLLLGEQDHVIKASERLRLGGEFSVGKWFNPNFGARLQYSGGNLRGFNYMAYAGGSYVHPDRTWATSPIGGYDMKYTEGPDGRGFWQDFTYESLTLDLMMNLSHLLRGYYKENAPVDVIPFIGAGWIHSVKSGTNPTMDNWGVKTGVRVNYNFHRRWAVYLEPQVTVTSEDLDGYRGTRGYDAILNLMAGVQFHINKGFSAPAASLSPNEINRINEQINEQYRIIEGQQNQLERQQEMLDRLGKEQSVAPRTSGQENTVSQKKTLPAYIRFGLNSATVDRIEKEKLEEAVAYLKERPGSKLMLIGYADKQTGNSDYNYKLSCRRVEAVAAFLQESGINKDRLIIRCEGDKEQPYEQNEWNRVVIMVER